MQLSPFGRRTSTSRNDSARHNSDTTQAKYLQSVYSRLHYASLLCACGCRWLLEVVDSPTIYYDLLLLLCHRRFIMVLLWLTAYDKRVNGTLIAAMMAGVKARGYYECNSDDLWLELLSTHMVRALMWTYGPSEFFCERTRDLSYIFFPRRICTRFYVRSIWTIFN